MKRREFIKGLGASLVMLSSGVSTSALATDIKTNKKNLVWVMLRGALDPLHTVVPLKDDNLLTLRPTLAKSVMKSALALDNQFGLNPALTHLHKWYLDKQLLPIVAVSSGYESRSHFDGQDYLESGGNLNNLDSGWLARSLSGLSNSAISTSKYSKQTSSAIAIANSTPISLRGSNAVNTWYPANIKAADDDIYRQLNNLYQDDKSLLQNLTDGLALQDTAMIDDNKKTSRKFIELAKACGNFLVKSDDIDCAMLEMGGFDTHNNQHKRLLKQLTELDSGLAALKSSLGSQWDDTVVIVATEFGRTVKENGTQGTDHGTGSAMFIAGGQVKGGKVLGDWPGLKTEQLFKQRDLQPTTNSFSWIASILKQHWQLSDDAIAKVLPLHKPYSNQIMM